MSSTAGTDTARDAAIARLKAKRAFQVSLASYVTVNLLLIVIWR